MNNKSKYINGDKPKVMQELLQTPPKIFRKLPIDARDWPLMSSTIQTGFRIHPPMLHYICLF